MSQPYRVRGDKKPRIAGGPKGLVREGNPNLETAGGRVFMTRKDCVVVVEGLG